MLRKDVKLNQVFYYKDAPRNKYAIPYKYVIPGSTYQPLDVLVSDINARDMAWEAEVVVVQEGSEPLGGGGHEADKLRGRAIGLLGGANREAVTAQKHYTGVKPEPIEVMEAWFPNSPRKWMVTKYLARAGRKGGLEEEIRDLEKCISYLQREINALRGKAEW